MICQFFKRGNNVLLWFYLVHPGAVREVQAIRTAVRPAAQVPVLDLVLLHLVRVRRVLVRLPKHVQKGSKYRFLYTNLMKLSKIIVIDLSTTRLSPHSHGK